MRDEVITHYSVIIYLILLGLNIIGLIASLIISVIDFPTKKYNQGDKNLQDKTQEDKK